MSKKAKRQVRKSTTVERSSSVSAMPSTTSTSSEQGFNPDYSYVVKDLKRIGFLAVTFFIILISLSFFLR